MAKEKLKLVNLNDPNEQHILKSTNTEDAALEALEMLGWGICSEGLKVKAWVKLLRKLRGEKDNDVINKRTQGKIA